MTALASKTQQAQRHVSLVIPAYNEALTLMASLTTLYAYMQALEGLFTFEMIVVNDGSRDETGAIADVFATERPEIRVLHHLVNSRLGEATRTGIDASTGDIVVIFDSDLSYSPDHIGRMIAALDEFHADIAVASPYGKGGKTTAVPFMRKFMSRTANRVLSVNTQFRHVKTITGMVRAYQGPFLRSLNLKAQGAEVNAEIMYKAQIMRARVVEIPAHLDWSQQKERLAHRSVNLRVSNTSKLFLFSSFLFRPFVFFVVPGLFLGFIAMWTLVSVLRSVYDEFQALPPGPFDPRLMDAFANAFAFRPHSFIVGGISLVIAVQLISLGLLAALSKRYFEELYNQQTRMSARLAESERRWNSLPASVSTPENVLAAVSVAPAVAVTDLSNDSSAEAT